MKPQPSGYLLQPKRTLPEAQAEIERSRRLRDGWTQETNEEINARFSAMARNKQTPEAQAIIRDFERFRREIETREEQKAVDSLIVWAASQND